MIFKTGDEFRAAIRAGNYNAADRLLIELRRQVEASWPTVGAQERQSMAAQVLELLTWARQSTLVKRSHVQRQLSQITRHRAYVSANARETRHLELEG
jgi:hypothetical protein